MSDTMAYFIAGTGAMLVLGGAGVAVGRLLRAIGNLQQRAEEYDYPPGLILGATATPELYPGASTLDNTIPDYDQPVSAAELADLELEYGRSFTPSEALTVIRRRRIADAVRAMYEERR